MRCYHNFFVKEEKKVIMFNKIIASVVSSVVMFACNVKEENPVSAADVVATSSPESSTVTVKQDSPTVLPDQSVSPAVVVPTASNTAATVVVPTGVTNNAPQTIAPVSVPATTPTPVVPSN